MPHRWQSPSFDLGNTATPRCHFGLPIFVAALFMGFAISRDAGAARFIAYFPLAADAQPAPAPADTPLPSESSGLAAKAYTDWKAYADAWRMHHAEPGNLSIRRQLGISEEPLTVAESDGRSTAASMRLPIVDLRRFETEHFVLMSDVAAERARSVAQDLERFYLVWTQVFFPLWKDREAWDRAVSRTRPRTTIKHRVVLLATANRYADLLKAEGPGVGRTTGFYSDLKRVTFMHDESGNDSPTWFHELTHQLLTEATDARPRLRPGERSDFWLVEGIACYMESTRLHAHHATIGGWESSRLQYARHRVLGLGAGLPLESLVGEGRVAVQRRQDLASWYSIVAAYTHQWIDSNDGGGLVELLQRLAVLYQIRTTAFADPTKNSLALTQVHPQSKQSLEDYLRINDDAVTELGHSELNELCLTRTSVTVDQLGQLAPQTNLKWLDLSFLAVTSEDVMRLCPNADKLKQLSLEATRIDDSIASWIANGVSLRELDLSSTRVGDEVIASLPRSASVETLWLTGSRISDASIDAIIGMKSLRRIDAQRTQVTDAGVERLRAARSDLEINPLEITSQ